MKKILAALLVASGCATHAPASAADYTIDRLVTGQDLRLGQSLRSVDGRHTLGLGQDGNLCLLSARGDAEQAVEWCTSTADSGATVLRLQDDGNLVLYTVNKVAVWNSKTHPYYDTKFRDTRFKPVLLVLSNEGVLTLRNAGGDPVWTVRPE